MENRVVNVTASIVTYNNEKDIKEVLNSLKDVTLVNFKIIVVDNNSKDNTKKIISENFPNVKLIALSNNIGFGAAHNIAIKNINSEYHIFINPDISVERGQIESMIQFMKNYSKVVMLSPKILNRDGTEQFLPKLFPKLKYFIGGRLENKGQIFFNWRSEYTLRNKKILEPIEIQFATGCFMLCRTDILKKVGGFDERYFLYFEDADLTREMMKYGKVIYNPNFYVTHGWKRDNVRDKKIGRIAIKSMFKYFRKWGYRS